MVNVLIGNKSTIELDTLCQKLANDKDYRIENVTTGKDAITMCLKLNPDILILDSSLPDMTIEDIVWIKQKINKKRIGIFTNP